MTAVSIRPILDVASDAGFEPDGVVPFGAYRAKISLDALSPPQGADEAQHVLVTAITPTTAGEGKTVTSIGLAMGLNAIGRRAIVNLRQSSLGPTLGGKGGGAGGGRAALVPIDECILGLADDLFAVEMANNLLAAVVEEHLFRAKVPLIDPRAVTWRRVLDVDDRTLRHVVTGLGSNSDGIVRQTGFDITAASEVMGLLALARDRTDLRARLGAIVVGFDRSGDALTAEQLGVAGAMAALLQRAASPNLVQTSGGTPALVHTGPFANIAPGNSSVIADRIATSRCEFVVTEAGFATELGAEKYFHLKVPISRLPPSAAVLVVTTRAVRSHDPGGIGIDTGLDNLRAHVSNLNAFGVPVVVAINEYPDDQSDDAHAISAAAIAAGAVSVCAHRGFAAGAEGCIELAEAVVDACRGPIEPIALYAPDSSAAEKVERIATTLYGASRVEWSPSADRAIERFTASGYGALPVCIAKTNRSLSHDPKLRGAPRDFVVPVTEVRLAAGAGYLTVLAGDIMTMPGLPALPRFAEIDVGPDGEITGLA